MLEINGKKHSNNTPSSFDTQRAVESAEKFCDKHYKKIKEKLEQRGIMIFQERQRDAASKYLKFVDVAEASVRRHSNKNEGISSM